MPRQKTTALVLDLLTKPRTIPGMVEITGRTKNEISQAVKSLRERGLIELIGQQEHDTTWTTPGRPAAIYQETGRKTNEQERNGSCFEKSGQNSA